jgi:uncharacterized protein YerC
MFEILLKTLSDLRNRSEIEEFLQDFLSPVEKIMLAKRLSIAVLLAKGYDYKSIRKTLRVSPPTIAQVALALKYAGRGYKRVVEKILKEEKMEDFWQKVDDVINDLVPPKGQNWSYWRKQRELNKRIHRKPF